MNDLIFFWLSKLLWIALSPDLVLVFLILLGVIMLLGGAVKKAKFLLSLSALILLAISILPLGSSMIAPLENRFPANPPLPPHVDGIICLGGGENPYLSHKREQAQLGDAAERIIAFVRLMRAYPKATPLFSGGSGDPAHPEYKDADVARMVLADLGIDSAAIVFESGSRNTYENGRISKAIARPEPGQTWILITSAAHMPRAVGVFRKLRWEVIPYPVDYVTPPEMTLGMNLDFSWNLNRLKDGLREWIGLTAYFLTGKTSAWFPGAA